jgi:hypothetical protein
MSSYRLREPRRMYEEPRRRRSFSRKPFGPKLYRHPKLRSLKCKNCRSPLQFVGTEILDYEKTVEAGVGYKLLGAHGKTGWRGQKLFEVLRCPKCSQLWIKEVKEL